MMAYHQSEDGRLTDTPLRKKFAKRANEQWTLVAGHQPKTLSATPLKDKCERQRKKYTRRSGSENDTRVKSDCRGCVKENNCHCGCDLNNCTERSLVLRCKICGQRVRFRVIDGVAWEACPVCRS